MLTVCLCSLVRTSDSSIATSAVTEQLDKMSRQGSMSHGGKAPVIDGYDEDDIELSSDDDADIDVGSPASLAQRTALQQRRSEHARAPMITRTHSPDVAARVGKAATARPRSLSSAGASPPKSSLLRSGERTRASPLRQSAERATAHSSKQRSSGERELRPQSPAPQPDVAAGAAVVDRRLVSEAVSDVVAVLRRDLPAFGDAWRALPSAERKATLLRAVVAAEKRLSSPSAGSGARTPTRTGSPAPANKADADSRPTASSSSSSSSSASKARPTRPAYMRTGRAQSMAIDDAQLNELKLMMGLNETADYEQIRGAAMSMRRHIENKRSLAATDLAKQLAALDSDPVRRLGKALPHIERALADTLREINASLEKKVLSQLIRETAEQVIFLYSFLFSFFGLFTLFGFMLYKVNYN